MTMPVIFLRVSLIMNYFGKDDGLELECLFNKKREETMTYLILKEILVPDGSKVRETLKQK